MSKQAVILAGGEGFRRGSYPTPLPKPLLPIGDKPILQLVVRQLRGCGFTDLTLAVGRLGHLIRALFGDGSKHGVRIDYHHEDEPLGTAGALAALEGLDRTFLVMGGAVLTALDYAALYRVHKDAGNLLTIAVHPLPARPEFRVLQRDDSAGGSQPVIGYEENREPAPVVSMGVYVAEPEVFDYIPTGRHFGVPELVSELIDAGEQVASYPFDGYWLDVGHEARPEKTPIG